VDVETVKFLADHNIADPQVVIVVAPSSDNEYSSRKEVRRVVPMKDLISYVEFRVPGKNKIWAFLSTLNSKEARERYLVKSGGDFCTDILSHDGNEWSYIFNFSDASGRHEPEMAAVVTDVSVPTVCFAKEPSQWERDWVNHLFRNKCLDQCEFRRRRLFAYLLQPFIMLVQIVLRALSVVVALLIGARNISLQPLFHPLRHDLGEAFDVMFGGSIFIRRLPEDSKSTPPDTVGGILSYLVRSFYLLPFMPAFFIPVTLLVLFGSAKFAWALVIAFFILLALVGLLLFVVGGGAKNSWKWLCKVWQGEVEDEELWYLDQSEIDLLTCSADQQARTFQSLPAKKKSLRLRFYNLKSKVCRPFSA
jgi:hypothetical protein